MRTDQLSMITIECPVHRLSRIFLSLALWASLWLMAGCDGSNPAKAIESARSNLAKGDHRAAVLEIKTALQAAPESPVARFLLGKALLASGNVVGAELELRKALSLNYAENEVVPELARAMILLGQSEKLREQFSRTQLTDAKAQAELQVMLAIAYAGLGLVDEARAAAEAALAAVPRYGPAVLFMVRARAARGDVDGALAELDAEIANTPHNFEAMKLKGDLLYFAKRDATAALAAYRQSIAAKPGYFDAHGGAMTVLLDKPDPQGAETQLELMRRSVPAHPQMLYFEGYLNLLQRKFDRAQEVAQQLLRAAPDNPRVLQLAGLVQLERGGFVQADSLLTKAVQLAPELSLARRGLAQTHLKRAEPAKALVVLQPLLARPQPAASDLKMQGQALMQQGDLAQAEAAFTKAANAAPGKSSYQIELAVSRVLRGDLESGLATLRTLAADKDSSEADLPLIATLMKKRDYPGALNAIDTLEKKQPGSPVPVNLRANLLLAQGDRAGATQAYQQALKLQPSFLPAATALAKIALADNKVADAQKLLADVLKADPKNPQALLENAKLRASTGASREDLLAMLKDAVQRTPEDAALRLALINYQIEINATKPALESARQAAAALPGSTVVMDALGRAQVAAGDVNQALATFSRLAQLIPNSPDPYLRLAWVQRIAKDGDAEVQNLKRAVSISQYNLTAQQALVNAYLAAGKAAEALEVARTVQKQRPTHDAGYVYEGTIEAKRGRVDQALQAYRAGMKATGGTSELVIGLHAGLTATKRAAQADKQADDWLKAHPNDTVFRFYLGDMALSRQDFLAAEAAYREVLKLQPEQPQALNNVAWLMATAKKPGAVALAEKANRLQPERSSFMDTLALALAAEGQPKRAVDVSKKALAIDGNNPTIRLNLAKFLIQAGDKPAARAELQALAWLGEKFPRQKEVAELLNAL